MKKYVLYPMLLAARIISNSYNMWYRTKFYIIASTIMAILFQLCEFHISLIVTITITLVLFVFMFGVVETITKIRIDSIRLNNAFVCRRSNMEISMSVKNARFYRSRDYIDAIGEIRGEFRREFIEAIGKAYANGYEEINMRTHKWVCKNVLCSIEVKSQWEIKCGSCEINCDIQEIACKPHEQKPRKFWIEVLSLVSFKSITKHSVDIHEKACEDRTLYNVKLVRINSI